MKTDLKLYRDRATHALSYPQLDNNFDRLMYWSGAYLLGNTYEPNEVVTDEGWLAIANKLTTERPAPQPTGDPTNAIELSPLFPPAFTDQTINSSAVLWGQRYTYDMDGYFNRIYWYISDGNVGNEIELWLVTDPTGTPRLQVLVPNFVIKAGDEGDWNVFSVGQRLVTAGSSFDIVALMWPTTSQQTWVGNWDYERKNGNPDQGKAWHQSGSNQDILRFHQVDENDVNQDANFQLLGPGSTISMAASGFEWTIVDINKITGSVWECQVEPASRAGEDNSNFTFTYFGAADMEYVRQDNYWASVPQVEGLFSADGSYPQVLEDNNLYGIDIEFQEALISDDWDLLSYVQGAIGGGNGAGGTYNETEGNGTSVSMGRRILNFVGTGGTTVQVTDDEPGNRTNVTVSSVSGGGGGMLFAQDITDLTTDRTGLINDGDPLELAIHHDLRWQGGQTLTYRASGKNLNFPSGVDNGFSFDAHGSDDWYQAADQSVARLDRFGWEGGNTETVRTTNHDALRAAWDVSRSTGGNKEGCPIIVTRGWAYCDPFEMADAADHHQDSEFLGENCWIRVPSTAVGSNKAYFQWSIGAQAHKQGIIRNVRWSGEETPAPPQPSPGWDRGAFPLVEVTSYALAIEHCYFKHSGNDNAAHLKVKQQQMLDLQFNTCEGNKLLDPKQGIGYHIDSVSDCVMRHCRSEGTRIGCLINDETQQRQRIPSTRIENFYAESTETAIVIQRGNVHVHGVYSSDDALVNVHIQNGAQECVLHLEDSQGYCIIDEGCFNNTVYIRGGGTTKRIEDRDGRNRIIPVLAGEALVSNRNGDPDGNRRIKHNWNTSYDNAVRSNEPGTTLPEHMAWSPIVGGAAHQVVHVVSGTEQVDFGTGNIFEPGFSFLYLELATNVVGCQVGVQVINGSTYYDWDTKSWPDTATRTLWLNVPTEPMLFMVPVYNDLINPLTNRNCRIRLQYRGPAGLDGTLNPTFDPGTDTFTSVAHGLHENQHMHFGGGTIPDGFVTNKSYRAVRVTDDTFQLAFYLDGDPITTSTTTGSGFGMFYYTGEIHQYYFMHSDARDCDYLFHIEDDDFGSARRWPASFNTKAELPDVTNYMVGTPVDVVNDVAVNNGRYVAGLAPIGSLAAAWVKSTDGAGATTFLGLTDVFAGTDYVGKQGLVATVRSAEDGLELAPVSGAATQSHGTMVGNEVLANQNITSTIVTINEYSDIEFAAVGCSLDVIAGSVTFAEAGLWDIRLQFSLQFDAITQNQSVLLRLLDSFGPGAVIEDVPWKLNNGATGGNFAYTLRVNITQTMVNEAHPIVWQMGGAVGSITSVFYHMLELDVTRIT